MRSKANGRLTAMQDGRGLDYRWRPRSLATDPAAWQRLMDNDIITAVARNDADAEWDASKKAEPRSVRIRTGFTNARMPKTMATPPVRTRCGF